MIYLLKIVLYALWLAISTLVLAAKAILLLIYGSVVDNHKFAIKLKILQLTSCEYEECNSSLFCDNCVRQNMCKFTISIA